MRSLYIFVMYIEMEIKTIPLSWQTFSKAVTLEEKGKNGEPNTEASLVTE